MKFTERLHLLLEASNQNLMWGDKSDFHLIFGGYSNDDTWDLMPLDKGILSLDHSMGSTFGHITSLLKLNSLIKNQNLKTKPLSTFKKLSGETFSMPSGAGTFVVLHGKPLIGSDTDLSSIPTKSGQRRYVNSSQFTGDFRFVDKEGYPNGDFFNSNEENRINNWVKLNFSIKKQIIESYNKQIEEMIKELKSQYEVKKTNKEISEFNEDPFQISADVVDKPHIDGWENFELLYNLLKEDWVDNKEILIKKYNAIKQKMVKEYYKEFKEQNKSFWGSDYNILYKILLPKKELWNVSSISSWNEFLIHYYTIEEFYVSNLVKLCKTQDLLLYALQALESFLLKYSSLHDKIFIENFEFEIGTKPNNKKKEIMAVIERIKSLKGLQILSSEAFKSAVATAMRKIENTPIK